MHYGWIVRVVNNFNRSGQAFVVIHCMLFDLKLMMDNLKPQAIANGELPILS
jgi:hypothetical protein